jgi:hypothetical protein
MYGSGSVVSYRSSVRSHMMRKSQELNDEDFETHYTFESNLALAQSVYSSPIRGRSRAGGCRSPSPVRPSTTSSSVSSRYRDPPSRPNTSSMSHSSYRSMSPNSKARCDINRLKDLAKPKSSRSKFTNSGISKNSWDFIEDHGREIPAAQYDTETAYKFLEQPGGGKFNKSEPKSDIDWKILKARNSPSPGDYDLKSSKVSGGGFSLAKPKTDIEWQIHKAQQSPGPGA